MKKLIPIIAVISLLSTSLISCNKQEKEDKLKICMVTDGRDINDKEANQLTWKGIDEYLSSKNYKINEDYKYLIPSSKDTEDLIIKIDEAANWGADAIICPSLFFNKAVYISQTKYPDIKFLIEDGTPWCDNFEPKIEKNTIAAYFNENELGFFAGYSAVKEGYTNLGFIGGGPIPNVQKFGIGFTAGAYYASFEDSKEINLTDESYVYVNSFSESNKVRVQADKLFEKGNDLILCSAGEAYKSVISSAEKNNKMIITSDFDDTDKSDCVLSSIVKNYEVITKTFLDELFNEFDGGKIINFGAKENAVGLIVSDKYKKFNKNDYQQIYKKIQLEQIIIPKKYDELELFVQKLNLDLKISKYTILGKNE